MIRKQLLVALGALSTALAACSAEITQDGTSSDKGGSGNGVSGATNNAGNSNNNNGAGGSGQNSSSGGNTSSSSGGSSSSSGGSINGSGGMQTDPSTCIPGIPATTQIPRMQNRMYDNAVRDLLGVTGVAAEQNKKPSELLNADFDGPMVPDAWRLYQSTAAAIAKEVMAGSNKSKFISCDPAATDCLKNTITTFGRKAFRRPLTDAEVTRFMKLGETTPKGTPAEVAETTLVAFLVSPSFILMPELTTTQDTSTQAIQLSPHEVAARLSFFLWGSVPDDMLNAAADQKQLGTKEQILAQAKRMIAVREKTAPLLQAFHRKWSQMDNNNGHWWKIDHDTAKYPLYNAAAKTVYQAETDKFFEDVAFNNGSFKDLFLSNVAYVNKDNAAIYGLDASSYGTELKRVTLDAAQRPGFMTRVGFLSSYSHYDETSPILRGAFITVNLLGVDPGPPIEGALQKPVPPGNYKTNREKTDALVNQEASCQGCHVRIINPSGYVMETYDSIGKWQTTDPLGGPINGTATVMFSASNTKEIKNPVELMQNIAETPKTRTFYARDWVSFAYGRQPNSNDQCVVEQLNTKLTDSGYSILTLLSDLTQADSFRLRVRATP
ncbi:MAG: DUF1592 domain-containing protein [Myxococcota bacterium]